MATPQYAEDKEKEERGGAVASSSPWFLKIGSKVRVMVDPGMQAKAFPGQKRIGFVADGVWAIKCFTTEGYRHFYNEYQR
ncbi:hypothetical protein HPP92_010523 [Vanilla planifolia]|uniref:DUF7135 domain-containing protein n=1 Tax=Vanilla planifolia TaxID=51239 RepID=A0A835V059_VANPL|nr:hypothetical protein HPP92_010523 [Vanilla planifolia]